VQNKQARKRNAKANKSGARAKILYQQPPTRLSNDLQLCANSLASRTDFPPAFGNY